MARTKRRHSSAENDYAENEMETGREEMEMENGHDEMESEAREAMGTAKRQARRMQHNAFDAFDMFSGPMARLMDQNWSIMQKMMHAMQEQSLNFVNRRLEHTSHAIENSRDCEGISGLISVQQEWMVDLARDYAEQSRRFAELMRDLAENGTSNMTEAASGIAERGRSESDRIRNDSGEESRRAAA